MTYQRITRRTPVESKPLRLKDTVFCTRADRYRVGLEMMAISVCPTHLVTLNTHREASLERAVGLLKRWRVETLRRLCGRRFFERQNSEVFEFIAFPELDTSRHPHFHLLVRVPLDLRSNFQDVFAERWKAIAPSGTSDIRLIELTGESLMRLINYVMKDVKQNSEHPFIDGRVAPRKAA